MWTVTIHTQVSPGKRKEYRQTLDMLIKEIQLYRGCLKCQYSVGSTNEDEFVMISKWDTRKSVDDYLGSHIHKVLTCAIKTLCDDREIVIAEATNRN